MAHLMGARPDMGEDGFIIFAHRGASGTEPENTLRSFRKAVTLGARWIELDVQNVRSRMVVFHDHRLDRTTDGRGRLADHDPEALRLLNAGSGERIPFLGDVLETLGGKACLNIELKGKNTAAGVSEHIERAAQNGSWKKAQFIVSSFHRRELAAFKVLQPAVRTGFLYDGRPLFLPRGFVRRLGPYSVHVRRDRVTVDLVAWCRSRRVRVFAYTVNDREEARRLRSLGVEGIFTDFPERFLGDTWGTPQKKPS
jgi:glycerophosphoryl diester phosphodiesterase